MASTLHDGWRCFVRHKAQAASKALIQIPSSPSFPFCDASWMQGSPYQSCTFAQAKRTILKTVKAELVQAQEAAKVAEAERSDASYQLKQCASTQSQMKQELADVRRKMEAQSASCAGCQLEMKENVTRADEQEADEQSLTLGANVTS